MIESFLNYLTAEKRASRLTIQAYSTDLVQFERFLSDTFPYTTLQECEHMMIRSWIVSLVEQNIQSRSVNRKIASLKAFFRFLQQRQIISSNPASKIKALKTPKPLPAFIKESEMEIMLDHTVFEENFEGKRDLLLLEMLYGTGMRLAEIISLQDSDVDVERSLIKVLGKRNKERFIPISKPLSDLIQDYRRFKRKAFEAASPSDFFVTVQGNKCYPMLIYRTVKKYLEACTTADRKSPHVLRHTFASHLLEKGADLNAVKDLLGHSSLAATQVYTHISLDKLKSAFDQAHPKAK